MWNDTEIPIAYLISFRAYGTWLHGDERGSVDRHNNKYGTPRIAPDNHLNEISIARMKHPPVKLAAAHRRSIEAAIRETCMKRCWGMLAINVRTNHAHVVTAIGGKKPYIALNAFKANATRQMRADGCWQYEHTPWAEKGSIRGLWNEKHIADAVEYVVNGQGIDLPKFD